MHSTCNMIGVKTGLIHSGEDLLPLIFSGMKKTRNYLG